MARFEGYFMEEPCGGELAENSQGGGRGGNGRNRGCYTCGEDGHMSRNCPTKDRQQLSGTSNATGGRCYNCGKDGHISRDCPNPKKEMGGGGSRSSCYNCGERGHMSRECAARRRQGGRQKFGFRSTSPSRNIASFMPSSNGGDDGGDQSTPPSVLPQTAPVVNYVYNTAVGMFSQPGGGPYDSNAYGSLPAPPSTFYRNTSTNQNRNSSRKALMSDGVPYDLTTTNCSLYSDNFFGEYDGRQFQHEFPSSDVRNVQRGGRSRKTVYEKSHSYNPAAIASQPLPQTTSPSASTLSTLSNRRSPMPPPPPPVTSFYSVPPPPLAYSNSNNNTATPPVSHTETPEVLDNGSMIFGQDAMEQQMRYLSTMLQQSTNLAAEDLGGERLPSSSLLSQASPAVWLKVTKDAYQQTDVVVLVSKSVGPEMDHVDDTSLVVQEETKDAEFKRNDRIDIKFVQSAGKKEALISLMKSDVANWFPNETARYSKKTVVFTGFKRMADHLAHSLTERVLASESAHDDCLPEVFESTLKRFSCGMFGILVTATYCADHPIFLDNVPATVDHVVIFDMPRRLEDLQLDFNVAGSSSLITIFYDSDTDKMYTPILMKVLQDAQIHVPGWLKKTANAECANVAPKITDWV